MKSSLNILHLEDDRNDALLVHALLQEQGIECDMERVQTRDEFVAALERGGMDLIFSDFTLPGFDGLAALTLAREKRPEVPFLFVSGTLGEEIAIDTLKRGATDYVLKRRLSRLAPTVRRALAESEERLARQQAEEVMIQSEFKYRHLFECLGEAAFLVDASTGRVLDANNQAELLLGRTRGEIMGLNQTQFHPPATLEEFRRRSDDADGQPARASLEGEVLRSDGRIVPVEISSSPLTLHGRPLRLALCRDITRRKQAAEQVRELNATLERHLRTRTGELDSASRELETHLRFLADHLHPRLRAMGEMLRQMAETTPTSGDSRRPNLLLLSKDISQARQIVDRLLAFTHRLRADIKRAPVDMAAMAHSVFQELKLNCPAREFSFEVEALPRAFGNPAEIRQVFSELLSNAIKFTGKRKPAVIKVGFLSEAAQNTYFASDNGVGFRPEEATRLFGVFERLHSAAGFDGIGLGLALVQRIILRHGGGVRAEGRLNAGAIFCFSLPTWNEAV